MEACVASLELGLPASVDETEALTIRHESDATRILSAVERGDPNAGEQVLPLVHGELHRLTAEKFAHEKVGQTPQATALVHEAVRRNCTAIPVLQGRLPG